MTKSTDNLSTISSQIQKYLEASPETDGLRVKRAKALIVAILISSTNHADNIYEAIGLLSDAQQEFSHLFDRKILKQNTNLN